MISESAFTPYSALSRLDCRAALVFAPHADDEVFGCGGALARHVDAGDRLTVIVLTDGAFRVADSQRADCIAARESESRAAAAALGTPAPQFWGLPDRGIVADTALVERMVVAIQASGADLVYAPALSEAHPDHRAVAQAAVRAVSRCGGDIRLAMYEVGMAVPANVLLDITSVWSRKQAAMSCFASQLTFQRYDEHIAGLNRYRTYTLGQEVRYAEAYAVYRADELHRCAAAIVRDGDGALPPWQAEALQTAVAREAEARQRVAELTDQLDALRASRSWRLTAPLRGLRQWLGKDA